jgi:uncharacterized membrane protein YedE/YeeE
MTQPHKVMGFLDLFGNWDPSLMFVMMGAIGVHFIMYKIIRKRKSPLFSMSWDMPDKKEITPALIIGSTLFGVGWGLAGFCPGPALTSIVSLEKNTLVFVLSMLIGMVLFNVLDKKFKFKK